MSASASAAVDVLAVTRTLISPPEARKAMDGLVEA